MKNKNIIIVIFLSLLLAGCSDWLDINHDPDAVEEVATADILLPAAQLGVANNLMGWHFGFGGGFWVQYWTQSYTASQFKTLCEYLNQDFGTAYQSLMAEPLPDLRRIIAMTAEDENKGYYFIAEALSIFTWQVITDIWGDMPYFEALRGDEGIYHPVQNKQEEIYTDLMKRVNALLTIDLSKSSINGDQDIIYGGDLSNWYRFANALKLKLMIRLSETPNYNNANVLDFIEKASLLRASAKIPGAFWSDDMPGKRHPMRAFQAGGANYFSTNVRACKTFIDYLKENDDPRLMKLFTDNAGKPFDPEKPEKYVVRGAFFGDFDSKEASDGSTADNAVAYSQVLFAPDADLILMSSWEISFYIAEVYARAGNHAKAKQYYEAGVTASFSQHGLRDVSILYGSGYARWVDGTVEEEIKQIAMQKWVAHCNYQHIESFFERNRTKYPAVNEIDIKANRKGAYTNFPVGDLTISVAGRQNLGGNLPASAMYPEVYIFRNNNSPAQKMNIGVKVWWDKKAGK